MAAFPAFTGGEQSPGTLHILIEARAGAWTEPSTMTVSVAKIKNNKIILKHKKTGRCPDWVASVSFW